MFKKKMSCTFILSLIALCLHSKEQLFTWEYDKAMWEMKVMLYEKTYTYFKQKDHKKEVDLFVSDPMDDEFLKTFSEDLKYYATQNNLKQEDIPYWVIAFVQSLPYVSDLDAYNQSDYRQYPYETLYMGGGDCEDSSILVAAILDAMGYDLVLLRYPNHIAIGIWSIQRAGTSIQYNGKQYFYLETTNRGWDIGELPPRYKDVEPKVLSIEPRIVLRMRLRTQFYFNDESADMSCTITLENKGTKTCHNLRFKIIVEDIYGISIFQKQSDTNELLHAGEKRDFYEWCRMMNPRRSVKVHVYVYENNDIIEEITSDRIDLH